MGKQGHPKIFDSGEKLIELWIDFCNDIVDHEYASVPTQTEFCRWLAENYKSTTRRTIYNSLNKYFPTIKKEFEQIQSDTIAQGAMLGHYNSTMSIFGLKNWCGWGDSGRSSVRVKDVEDDPLTKALKEEAERMENESKTQKG